MVFININGRNVEYKLVRKNVKNINIRVSKDKGLVVSAPYLAPHIKIEKFMMSKGDWIIAHLDKYAEEKQKEIQGKNEPLRSREELEFLVNNFAHVYFNKMVQQENRTDIQFPKIKYRMMKSRWGVCNVTKGTITFSLMLLARPKECVEYIVVHELSHLIVPNHSKDFYNIVESLLPNWKEAKKLL